MTEERTIAVGMHGRYLVAAPAGTTAGSPTNAPMLAGFHGYAEDAELHHAAAFNSWRRWLADRFHSRPAPLLSGPLTRRRSELDDAAGSRADDCRQLVL